MVSMFLSAKDYYDIIWNLLIVRLHAQLNGRLISCVWAVTFSPVTEISLVAIDLLKGDLDIVPASIGDLKQLMNVTTLKAVSSEKQ